jgi:hypothetical protein
MVEKCVFTCEGLYTWWQERDSHAGPIINGPQTNVPSGGGGGGGAGEGAG